MKPLHSHALAAVIGAAVGAAGVASYSNSTPIAGLSEEETSTLVSDLAREEGWKPCQYDDTLGYHTIGYGSLLPLSDDEQRILSLPAMPSCINQRQGRELLAHRVNQAAVAFEGQFDAFNSLGPHIRIALVDSAYQLGAHGLLSFKGALTALSQGHCQAAIQGFEASKWAHQTPARVNHLTDAIKSDCAQ